MSREGPSQQSVPTHQAVVEGDLLLWPKGGVVSTQGIGSPPFRPAPTIPLLLLFCLLAFIVLVSEPHPVVLMSYFWLSTQKLLMAGPGGTLWDAGDAT